MKRIKMERLNALFEKMVANRADNDERCELRVLYQEYIDDGRSDGYQSQPAEPPMQVANW
ncbi:MAG: hypothetical protein MJK12_15805 [Colwellia sp.]|nr:hypothetical protein [Colwellia sp.]